MQSRWVDLEERKEAERRKRRREFYVILFVALLIVGITYLEIHLPGFKGRLPLSLIHI